MSAWTVRVAVAAEGVGAAGEVANSTVVVSPVAIPRGWTIADRRLGDTNNRPVAHGLLRLFATLWAGNGLQNVGHRHPLVGAGSA